MTLIFPIQNEIKIWENPSQAFIFGQNHLRFFCVESWNHNTKNYEIAIVKFGQFHETKEKINQNKSQHSNKT